MSCPPFTAGCSDCGDEGLPVQTIPVPYCGQEEMSGNCVSYKGKFYDRLTEDFIVPCSGKTAKIYVCEANLWSKCQWVGICTGPEKIAAFQIMEIGNKSITILNGCRTGEEIFGNPEKGTIIPSGSVFYPIPPQGCQANLCAQISNIITTCGVDAVLEVLKTSDEICFTSVPELDETERGHLFVGTMPDICNCPEDYGYGEVEGGISQNPENPWRSCLRKLTKIISNLGGRTLCFLDAPVYDADNDPNERGRAAVFNEKGCLAKGEALNSCKESLAVGEDDGADAIIVCRNGVKRILVPTCDSMIVGCCDDGDDPKWYVRKKGLTLHLLETPILVHKAGWIEFGASVTPAPSLPITVSVQKEFDVDLIPEHCEDNVYALVDFQGRYTDIGSSSAVNVDVSFNGVQTRKLVANASGASMFGFQDIIKLKNPNKNEFDYLWTKISGTGSHRVNVRILGFYA